MYIMHVECLVGLACVGGGTTRSFHLAMAEATIVTIAWARSVTSTSEPVAHIPRPRGKVVHMPPWTVAPLDESEPASHRAENITSWKLFKANNVAHATMGFLTA